VTAKYTALGVERRWHVRQRLLLEMGTIVVVADSTLARLGSIAERRWGLVTTAQAENAGFSRKQLARMASAGAIECVAQGFTGWLGLRGRITRRSTRPGWLWAVRPRSVRGPGSYRSWQPVTCSSWRGGRPEGWVHG
jgi:hypothetical protein